MTNISGRKIFWIILFIAALITSWGPQGPFFPSFVLMIAALFAIIFESLDKSYYAKISIIALFSLLILCSIWILLKGTSPDVIIILIISIGYLIVKILIYLGYISNLKWFSKGNEK
ncbi:MAG: hypothetical protein HVN34_06225 [Methanobacteriaceae archaeon]|jgi:hypothetical protein|nr:hypothetical protein [Methanobacteriaceae archaeon]